MANYNSELTGAQIESALTAINGVASNANNGKILCVNNGVITAKSAIEIQGGTIDALNITSNGTYTHTALGGYSPITVNVPTAAVTETLSVTANGTYTPASGIDGFSQVAVNVSGGAEQLSEVSVTLGQNVSTTGSHLKLLKSSKGVFGAITLNTTRGIQYGETLCTIDVQNNFIGIMFDLYDTTPYINNSCSYFTCNQGTITATKDINTTHFVTLIFNNYIGGGDQIQFTPQSYIDASKLSITDVGNYIYMNGYIKFGSSGSFPQDQWVPLLTIDNYGTLSTQIPGSPVEGYNSYYIYHRGTYISNGTLNIWTKGNKEYGGILPFNYFIPKPQ